ncbi:hypothetical protein NDU88_001926 [Pleurodeles waltl]|uniref:Uncharacterized protein n=1 Tax=Pleurodeles waltl TaxID=8319 RepID=A0AAV7SC90_PLEWA|nr:hypothetical protein NDU88_001926 [Pleurodeles waltl]
MGPLHLSFTRSPGILLCAATRGDSGCYGTHSGAAGPPRGLRPAGPPTALPTPGARPSVPTSGLQRPELLQFLRGSGGCRLRSASPLESPAPAGGQAAGSEVRRLGSDLCNRVQTGLRGSPAVPLRSPPQHQHRLPRGRLVMFG